MEQDMKEELGSFKEEVNQKLSEIGVELKNAEVRMDEVDTEVAKVDEWNANAKGMLLETLQQQALIHSKLVDLEARFASLKSRRVRGVTVLVRFWRS